MRRSLKYGLYGAVLAGVVGGSAAFATAAQGTPVTLTVDGQSSQIQTTAADVAGVLKGAGYTVGSHDIVAPGVSSRVSDNETIVYKRGRLLHLDIDGVQKNVWTTEPTVALALNALGYSSADFVSVSRSRRLPLTATDIELRSPKTITLVHDGQTSQLSTTAATVSDVLRDLDVSVGGQDIVRPAATTAVAAGMTIQVQRVVTKRETVQQSINPPVTKQADASMYVGQTRVLTPGKAGSQNVTYDVVYIDGQPANRTVVASQVTAQPSPETLAVGTQQQPVPAGNGLDWEAVAQCESGGNWSINTGNGFYGGLQFNYSTWLSNGGGAYAPRADLATEAQQIAIATKLYNARGSSPWPVCGSRL